MAIGKEIEKRGHITGFKEEINKAARENKDTFFPGLMPLTMWMRPLFGDNGIFYITLPIPLPAILPFLKR